MEVTDLLNQAAQETASKESARLRVCTETSCLTRDVLANDGDFDTVTKSSIAGGEPHEASSDDATNHSPVCCPHPAASVHLPPRPSSFRPILMEVTDLLNQAAQETASKESARLRVCTETSCLTRDVLANDGDFDTVTKSSIAGGEPHEASSDDDWETRADAEPDELLPKQQLPEVSKISLQDVVEIPKRRGRGTFSYTKEASYSDQHAEEYTNCDPEHQKFDDSAKQDSTVKTFPYGTRHVLVLDGFAPSYNTMSLENIFKDFKDKFAIRWVNDTVALAVFRSPSTALEACNSVKCGFSVRLLEEDDILIGSISGRDLEPPKQRPQTSARTAQRLIAHGMGIKLPVSTGSSESRRQEEERKKRIIARQKLKDDAWGPDD